MRIKIMGKKSNGNKARNVEGLENNHPMAGCVNGQSESTRSVKKSCKDVPVTRRGSRLVDQENGPSSLHNLRKTAKKKRIKKMGDPIIVEDAASEFSSVPVPLPLRHRSTEDPVAASFSLGSFKLGGRNRNREKTTARALVTTAECIKPEVDESWKKFGISNEEQESMEVEDEGVVDNQDEASFHLATEETAPPESLESGGMKNAEKRETGSEAAEGPSSSIDGRQLPRFYSFRNKVLAIMETDCKFSFHGKLRVSVLYGAVRIYGYTLNSTGVPLCVYSPRAYSPVAIEAIESEITRRADENILESLEEPCNDRKLADRLRSDVRSCEEGWAIVMLENFDNELTKFLNANCPFHLFPRIDDPSNHSWRDPRRAEIVLQSNLRFQDPYKQRVTIDSRGIDDVADAITYDWETMKNSRTVIAGGKGVGKSTMARYLVNKFLAKSEAVLFLDLDPGQAEFTPAGCISLSIVEEPLLGPNFTHLGTPHSQLYVGSADITRCLVHYVDGIKKLVRLVNDDARLSHRPLVVNTMGYCKGIGWDVIGYVIKILSPTDVVQILSRRWRNNFDDTLSRQVIDRQNLGWITWRKDASNKPTRHRLHVIYSEAETGTGPAESWNLEAHQQRDLVMISYLSGIVRTNEPTVSLTRGISSTINAVPPYAVPFAAMSVSLAGAFIPQVLSVMNGNIVALCGIDLESTEKSNSEESSTGFYPRVLIRPPLSTCYGFGILRGVDMEREQLFLNTPLSPAHMRHVNCLVGSTNLPQSLLQLDRQGAPYTGSECDLPTCRGPRRGYFRTRYQADT